MLQRLQNSLELIVQQTHANLYFLAMILLLLWAILLLSFLTGYRLLSLGIIPRTFIGLRGILFAPFLHAGFNHLFFNSIPLVVLSNFLLIEGQSFFYRSTAFIIFVSGSLTWLIGKRGLHIGASGLISGYWALLVAQAAQTNNLTAIILGFISLYYFAGIFFGALPSRNRGISWEGHLSGLVAGIIFFLISG